MVTARVGCQKINYGLWVCSQCVCLCVFTWVHELPQLVHQCFITQARLWCLCERWVLTEHAKDLMSDCGIKNIFSQTSSFLTVTFLWKWLFFMVLHLYTSAIFFYWSALVYLQYFLNVLDAQLLINCCVLSAAEFYCILILYLLINLHLPSPFYFI